MYTLYWSRDTGALAPQALLEETGAEWRKVVVDTEAGTHRQPDYLALNPLGQVPALGLPDGSVITESAAMMLHLADCFPEAGLAPEPGTGERAHYYRWLVFLAVNPYTADLRYYYADRYAGGAPGVPGVKRAALEDLGRHIQIVEAALAPGAWLLGGRFSGADIYLAMLAGWHPEAAWLSAHCPRVAALRERVFARPACARALADNA